MIVLRTLLDTRIDAASQSFKLRSASYVVFTLVRFESDDEDRCVRCRTSIVKECIAIQVGNHFYPCNDTPLTPPVYAYFCRDCGQQGYPWYRAGTVWHKGKSLEQEIDPSITWEEYGCGPYCTALHLTWSSEVEAKEDRFCFPHSPKSDYLGKLDVGSLFNQST